MNIYDKHDKADAKLFMTTSFHKHSLKKEKRMDSVITLNFVITK